MCCVLSAPHHPPHPSPAAPPCSQVRSHHPALNSRELIICTTHLAINHVPCNRAFRALSNCCPTFHLLMDRLLNENMSEWRAGVSYIISIFVSLILPGSCCIIIYLLSRNYPSLQNPLRKDLILRQRPFPKT